MREICLILPSVILAAAVASAQPEFEDVHAVRKERGVYGYRGMNGNYAGGVLEGVVHFVPEADAWLDEVTLE